MATITYKCPNCDGGLIFDPDTQKFQCEYCLSGFTEEELKEMEAASASDQVSDRPASDLLMYTCPSCGAEVVADQTTAATFCYYCHNPVVLSGKLEGGFQPDFVVPFRLDKEKAVKTFQEWIRKKRYVPKEFYSEDQIEKMSGVYFPYWLYSCQVDGSMNAEAAKIRVWRTGDIQYTETKKYQIEREGTMEVKNLARNALHRASKKLVEGVLPFDMKEMRVFQAGYLAGFLAERRDMDRQQFQSEVENEVREFAISSLQNSAGGYDSIGVKQHAERIRNPKWIYALMPVWTVTYKDAKKDRLYYFALNGQNGKICGELPVSMGKLAGLFATVFFPVLGLLLLGGYLI